jgi:hypothetical protein
VHYCGKDKILETIDSSAPLRLRDKALACGKEYRKNTGCFTPFEESISVIIRSKD